MAGVGKGKGTSAQLGLYANAFATAKPCPLVDVLPAEPIPRAKAAVLGMLPVLSGPACTPSAKDPAPCDLVPRVSSLVTYNANPDDLIATISDAPDLDSAHFDAHQKREGAHASFCDQPHGPGRIDVPGSEAHKLLPHHEQHISGGEVDTGPMVIDIAKDDYAPAQPHANLQPRWADITDEDDDPLTQWWHQDNLKCSTGSRDLHCEPEEEPLRLPAQLHDHGVGHTWRRGPDLLWRRAHNRA